ncbi:hypothetical protein DVH24_000011 [Malus domestica]|uniref:Protein kinase domain-containing protein n=1 Tax=Malus domestica TaxID=3750 RepID=A0A498J345_MALDO|nr:hypothetical protein DVH24_000011 [Malus domestica]
MCLTLYKHGGASTIFESQECLQWRHSDWYASCSRSMSSYETAVLKDRTRLLEDHILCALDFIIPFPGNGGGIEEVRVGIVAVFYGHNGSEVGDMDSKLLLEYFDLHMHFLVNSIGELRNLESFDVSGNRFFGRIPLSLNKSQTLTYQNLSFNYFEGMIPSGGIFEAVSYTSFLGNQHICGTLSHIHINIPINNMLGVLLDGTTIAVKVLHLQPGNSTKSFTRECQVLRSIRHINLTTIITACSLPDFKASVVPYMANGSLDSRLYQHSKTDLSSGLAYLHHHSPVKVIHCDLKPSNVLLNDDMTALVSDFGIARLLIAGGGNSALGNMGNSTANMLSPEYAYGSNASTKGNVYSFGILVLEMVTRKRPTQVGQEPLSWKGGKSG